MMSRSKKGLRFAAVSTVALLAAGAGSSGCNSDESVATVECESIRSYYANQVHAVIVNRCSACHNGQGVAANSGFTVVNPAEAGFIEKNIESLRNVASLEADGESLLLLKPTEGMPHEGGKVLEVGSDDYKRLLGMVVRLKNEQECEPNDADVFTGTVLLGPEATIRKAAIILVGRLPTETELERVREGGFPAVETILDEMMTEEKFFDFVKSAYGDMFQTDFYIRNDAQGRIADVYANAEWYMNDTEAKAMVERYGLSSYEEVEMFTTQSIAREPLELIEWVVKNDLPFSEIITANYMMFSPFSAKSYGVADQLEFEGGDPMEFLPAQLPSGDYYGDGDTPDYEYFPHAGVLTSPMFLSRWPSTPTNRNRARARVFIDFFMGTDILKTAEQPLDQPQDAQNPTRDNPSCTVCHAKVDPIAGAFQAWDDDGIWDPGLTYLENETPDGGWYAEMFPPGIGDARLDNQTAKQGLPWLAAQIAGTDGFRTSVVYALYEGLTGREVLTPPTDFNDEGYQAQFDSFLAQANTFRAVSEKFKENDLNAKTVVKELVMSPYFRAVNAVEGISPDDLTRLGEVGLAKLLTPEQLHDKILAIFGVPWADTGVDPDNPLSPKTEPYLKYRGQNLGTTGTFQLFYGGVDFNNVSARIHDPNGLMAAVAERMANEMSCLAVPADLARAPESRRLFDIVTIDGQEYDPVNLAPESGGLAVPGAVAGIKQTIADLHNKVLGEQLSVDDPEVERTYQLFLETWREGTTKMELEPDDADFVGSALPDGCRVTRDYWTGRDLDEELQVIDDENYTIRSWMAVMTYLLSDYRFLYE